MPDRALWPLVGKEQEKRRVKDPWEDILHDIPTHVCLDEHKRVTPMHLKRGDEELDFYIQIRHLDSGRRR